MQLPDLSFPFFLPDAVMLQPPGGQLLHIMGGHENEIVSVDISQDSSMAVSCKLCIIPFSDKFLLDRDPFCGATGTLCFGIRMTVHRFLSQVGLIVACINLLLDPQDLLCLSALGIEPGMSCIYGKNDTTVPARPGLCTS